MLDALGIDWVLDWNRVINLVIVLLPFFTLVGAGFKYLLDRAERRELAREKALEEKRQQELEDMNNARRAFHDDILKEASRMRELYENELGRGLALRTALADAAQREMKLQETIIDLTRKVDEMQVEITTLRRELAAK